MKKLFLALAINLALIGCNKDVPELQFNDVSFEKVSEVNCNSEEENCTFISLKVPMAEGDDERSELINSQITQHIIQLVDYQDQENLESLEDLSYQFIKDYEATSTEFPEYNIPWEAYIESEITHNTEELISIQFDLSLFTGGAHGYTSTTYLNFDPETGKLLSIKELFSDEFKEFAEKRFRTKNEIPITDSINSTGFYFENDAFQLPKNIGFKKNKVILRYNAYEIASYADGNIQMEFTLKEIEPFANFL